MQIKANITSLKKLKKITDKFLGKSINTIFELGARYCEDTIEIANLYKDSRIFAFECNPQTLPQCRDVVKGNNRIILIESAVGNYDGTIKFYPINKDKTKTTWEDGNQGASSIFKASGKYPVEEYVQNEIEVPVKKLSSVMNDCQINYIDVMWMDIQGAELLALKGLEEKLRNVSIIHTEVEFLEIYHGQPLFSDIQKFLLENGFKLYGFTNKHEYAGDAVFINQHLLRKNFRNRFFWLMR